MSHFIGDLWGEGKEWKPKCEIYGTAKRLASQEKTMKRLSWIVARSDRSKPLWFLPRLTSRPKEYASFQDALGYFLKTCNSIKAERHFLWIMQRELFWA